MVQKEPCPDQRQAALPLEAGLWETETAEPQPPRPLVPARAPGGVGERREIGLAFPVVGAAPTAAYVFIAHERRDELALMRTGATQVLASQFWNRALQRR